MKKFLLFSLLIFLLSECNSGSSSDLQNKLDEANKKIAELEKQLREKPSENENVPERFVANTTEEYMKLIANPKADIVRSMEDFDKEVNGKKEVFFSKLDPVTLKKFKDDLKFRDGKLIAANYGVIQRKLIRPEFRRFWNRFGISLDLMADHEG